MKKNTSNILFSVLMLVLAACGGNDKKAETTVKPEQVVAQATEVISVGKILPKDGIIELSSTLSGTIDRIGVKAGDSVKKGAFVLALRAQEEQLAAGESSAQVAEQVAKNAADAYEVKLASLKLQELSAKYETSKVLAEKGAETQEILNTDYINYRQQLEKVAQAKQTVKANAQTLQELRQRQRLSGLNLNNRKIKAPADGIILSMDVRPGQVLQANTTFAELAPAKELVAECEVDELYASKVKIGQGVIIYPVSSGSTIAEGQISFVGASLQDKSILYEKIGEGTDRRVRRITVTISKSERPLLINDKVECKIILK